MARVVQLATHLEQKRLAEIAYETRRFVRIGESDVVINQRIADKSQPLINIYHYHCNHLGTPQELSDEKGDIVWLSYDRAWGGSFDSIYKQQFIDNFAIMENELQPIKFQGQSLDTETGLHYNRFRYYDSDVGMFISRDPIGLLGGNNVFQYAPNPIQFIDPFGLVHEKTKGYSVYGLYDVNPTTGKLSDKPYYIGITNDIDRRTAEHLDSGRLSDNTILKPIKENITYGQARGYEQALIEHHKTRTGIIGEKISQSNRGNKYNSFDINSKTRGRVRQRYFKRHYKKMLKKLKGGCI